MISFFSSPESASGERAVSPFDPLSVLSAAAEGVTPSDVPTVGLLFEQAVNIAVINRAAKNNFLLFIVFSFFIIYF